MHAPWMKGTMLNPGTGTFTLTPVTGYPNISDLFVTGQLVSYMAYDSTNNPLEGGVGTVTNAAGNIVARTDVTYTESGGVFSAAPAGALNLTGTITIECSLLPQNIVPSVPGITAFPPAAAMRAYMPSNIYVPASMAPLNPSAVNRIHYTPYKIEFRGKVNAFVLKTVQAATLDVGLYQCDPNGDPGGALIVSNQNFSATPGTNVLTFSTQRIVPGWYMLALNSSNASAQISAGILLQGTWGFDWINGAQFTFRYETRTVGTLPATPAPSTGPIAIQAGVPNTFLVGLQAA